MFCVCLLLGLGLVVFLVCERQGASRRYPRRNEPTASALSLMKIANSKHGLNS